MRTKFSGILTLLLAFAVQFTFAQQQSISGTVTDDIGLPLPGVNIIIKGTTTGTQSDFDGNYSINASAGQTLVFSYVGFDTQERAVTAATTTVSVQLASGAMLDEVVITTYGRVTQRDLTANIATLDTDLVTSITSANVAAGLQGATSGIQVGGTSGAPGGEVSVRIRGASTINGNSTPLYIVDGIPIFTESTLSNNFGNQQNSALSNINPDDIESIQVLKDAAATAVYGNRGSNGVIIITTKRGTRDEFRVSVNSDVGFQNPLDKFETMNLGQWLNFRDIAAQNSGAASGSFSAGFTGDPNLINLSPQALEAFYLSQAEVGDNYLDLLYVDNALVYNNNFNVSGGNDKTRLYFGASQFSQEGTLLTQDFERRSARLNLTQEINDGLTFTGTASFTDEIINQLTNDNNIFGAISTGILERPGNSIYDENGDFTSFQQFTFSNPIQNAVEDKGQGRTFRTLASGQLDFRITENFSVETLVALDQSEYRQRIFYPSTTARGNSGVENGFGREDHNTRRVYQVRQSFNYNANLSDNIRMRFYLGGEYENRYSRFLNARAENFPNNNLTYLTSAATPLEAFSSFSEERRVSGISRLGFTFYNKLILEGSFRADASSILPKESRLAYYPGLSFAYTISEENFMKNTFIDYFRLRASWGITGNDTAFNLRYLSPNINTANYAGQPAIISEIIAFEPRWEETRTIDFGFNTRFLNNRVDLGYSYFDKTTNNESLVLSFNTSPGTGGLNTRGNLASMKNSGHEIDLSINIIDKNDFSWTATVNYGSLNNKVTKIGRDDEGNTRPITAGFVNRVDEGFPLGFFYVLEADGLYQNIDEIPASLQALGVGPGDVRYVDQNGDGIINAEDFINGGSPWADYTVNFSSKINYKKFDFSFLWTMSEGNQVFNSTLRFAGVSGGPNFNKFTSQLNWWTPDNTDTDIPRPNAQTAGYNNQVSTRFVEDASYIKLRNITLGYTLPSIKGIQNARVYISGDNLLTFTDYSGIDPEINSFGDTNLSRGTDFLTQGGIRTWKFGINLTF